VVLAVFALGSPGRGGDGARTRRAAAANVRSQRRAGRRECEVPDPRARRRAFPDTAFTWRPAIVRSRSSSTRVLGYSTQPGSGSNHEGFGTAVDSVGNAYVTGSTLSSDVRASSFSLPPTRGRRDRYVRGQARSDRRPQCSTRRWSGATIRTSPSASRWTWPPAPTWPARA